MEPSNGLTSSRMFLTEQLLVIRKLLLWSLMGFSCQAKEQAASTLSPLIIRETITRVSHSLKKKMAGFTTWLSGEILTRMVEWISSPPGPKARGAISRENCFGLNNLLLTLLVLLGRRPFWLMDQMCCLLLPTLMRVMILFNSMLLNSFLLL